jgi:hypothetical protein
MAADYALSVTANVISVSMLVISEILGIKNGTGTCSSILQLTMSGCQYLYNCFFPAKPPAIPAPVTAPPPVQSSRRRADWLI